jgi:hypothetical protein
MQVSHGRSGQPSEQRTATFTGTVHMDPVMNVPGVMINTVIFTPGARTHWHRHPGGQLLVVTAGRGIVATRAADTGFSPAGGAARGRTMLMDTVPEQHHLHSVPAIHTGLSQRQPVAALASASASSAGRVNMDSWLPGTRTGETLIRSAKRSQPNSPGGKATSSEDST